MRKAEEQKETQRLLARHTCKFWAKALELELKRHQFIAEVNSYEKNIKQGYGNILKRISKVLRKF